MEGEKESVVETKVEEVKETQEKTNKTLEEHILTIKSFDWLHDGNNKSGEITFNSDYSLVASFGHGTWSVLSKSCIKAYFGIEHVLFFNNTLEASLINPMRTPQTKMTPT